MEAVAERVQAIAADERGEHVDIELVKNPRGDGETLVEDFAVDTTKTQTAVVNRQT